jgi:hypothetical protein
MADTGPKPFVFVLMPFDAAFDDIYKLGINAACEDAGAHAERVDEQVYDGSILTRIYNQIAKADIIVADMTGRNPNVFYETGYAHALDQRVILLTQCADDIPFDLKHHPHIVYAGRIYDLKEELVRSLKWAIDNPKRSLGGYQPDLEFSVAGVSLSTNPTIECPLHIGGRLNYVALRIDAYNSAEREVHTTSFQLSVVSPPYFPGNIPNHRERLNPGATAPDGKKVHVFDRIHQVLPGAWLSNIQLDLQVDFYPTTNDTYPLLLRVLTEGAPQELPFSIKVVDEE